MLPLANIAGVCVLIVSVVFATRYASSRVTRRMEDPDRVDLTGDPDSYTHHSTY